MMPAEFFTSTVKLSELPTDYQPQVAMVGRSNVGKSSMINHLTHQKNLARVSSGPGRTQTINLYHIDERFFLVDLPGYGYARASKEGRQVFSEMIHDYLAYTRQLRLVLLIIDARIPFSDLDTKMIAWLTKKEIPFVIVMNKMDKLTGAEARKLNAELEAKYPGVSRIEHSITSATNRDKLWAAIKIAVATPERELPEAIAEDDGFDLIEEVPSADVEVLE